MTRLVAAVSVVVLGTIAVPGTGLAEGSGLAASAHRPGVVWVVEDSGDPVTHAFAADGSAAGSITLDGWNNRDTEALAAGPDGTLWIADIGDNRAVRESVVVHVVDEPEGDEDVVVSPTSYRIAYPDGPRDAETFLVDPTTGRAYVVSKAIEDPQLYALPAELTPGATHEVAPVAPAPVLVTDGAFTPDGDRLVLRDYFAAFVYDVERDADGVLVGLDDPAPLEIPAQGQGESLAIGADGTTVLLGSEGTDEPIHAVPLPEADGPDPVPTTPVADPTAGSVTAPGPTPTADLATDVARGLAGPVGTTLIAMAGLAAAGTVGWLVWIRARRTRTGRRRRKEH